MSDRILQEGAATRLIIFLRQYRWRFFLPLMLVLTVFVVILTAGSSAVLLPPQLDIFAPYRTLFPGRAEAEIYQYPCTLFEAVPEVGHGTRKVMCVLTPENGIFRRVSVFVTDGIITGVNFHMRNVRLVDLIWQWGQPDQFYTVGRTYKVVWKQHLNITAEIDRRYSMQAQVRLVAITPTAPADPSSTDTSYLCGESNENPADVWACSFAYALDRH